jgi:hypothetical protein
MFFSQQKPPAMFDDIRAYTDQELRPTLERLWADPEFTSVVAALPFIDSVEALKQASLQCTSINQLHKNVIHRLLTLLAEKTCASLQGEGFEKINPEKAYIYMSNHRDIVLDSSFLSVILLNNGLKNILFEKFPVFLFNRFVCQKVILVEKLFGIFREVWSDVVHRPSIVEGFGR